MADINLAGIASQEILNRLPEGVAVLAPSRAIVWANQWFKDWFGRVDRVGEDFYSALGYPEVQSPGVCPLEACFKQHQVSRATLKREPNETIMKIVSGWPRNFEGKRGRELGFKAESSFEEIIRVHIEDELGGKIA